MPSTADLDRDGREALEETIEHLNANHADSVLLVARYAAGCVEADGAELSGVDREGVDIDVRLGDRRTPVRWIFGETAASVAEVRAQLYAAVSTARSAAGDRMPTTSIERESKQQTLIPDLHHDRCGHLAGHRRTDRGRVGRRARRLHHARRRPVLLHDDAAAGCGADSRRLHDGPLHGPGG